MIKYFVEYLQPGILMAETYNKEIPAREIQYAPENCPGFRFYDREVVELDGEELQGKPKNYSNYFYRGTELTLEKVKETMSDHRILIENMECNHYDRVVQIKNGQIWPLHDGDIVL